MHQHDRALVLASLATAIERALRQSLDPVIDLAGRSDRLAHRLLCHNRIQLERAVDDLRRSSARLARPRDRADGRDRRAVAA